MLWLFYNGNWVAFGGGWGPRTAPPREVQCKVSGVWCRIFFFVRPCSNLTFPVFFVDWVGGLGLKSSRGLGRRFRLLYTWCMFSCTTKRWYLANTLLFSSSVSVNRGCYFNYLLATPESRSTVARPQFFVNKIAGVETSSRLCI